MKVYLVGGAVRDRLLKRPIKERDWVVIGATVPEMLAKGFVPVGKDFPVFLHPKTKEEYALARTERKVAPGYKGFVFNADPTVTLEADLERRDLTMNAIAEDAAGYLIDPFGGVVDIEQKKLRHVSQAFTEDPVRLLRIARFAAQFPEFVVVDETLKLMQHMVANGEVNHLVAERVWKELEKALIAEQPLRFFEVLKAANAASVIFPEWKDFSRLSLANDALGRFVLLCYGLSVESIQALCLRLRVPHDYRDMAILIARFYQAYCEMKNAKQALILLQQVDGLRRGARLEQFTHLCALLSQDRKPEKWLRQALDLVKAVDVAAIAREHAHDKQKMIALIEKARLKALHSIDFKS